MKQITISQVTPTELIELINEGIRSQLQAYTAHIYPRLPQDNKPHLTKRETAKFFDVSINCITDWSNKGILNAYKVGQRVYFSKEDCIKILFKNKKK